MTAASRFVACEFIGGPRDGERVVWLVPAPPIIVIPMPRRPTTATAADPAADPEFRIGEYRQSEKAHHYHTVLIANEVLARARSANLAVECALDGRPALRYEWCGEP